MAAKRPALTTCTDPLFLALLMCMGEKTSRISAGQISWYGQKGKKEIPLAVGTVEPLFVWWPRPAIEWLSTRNEVVREVAAPRDSMNASELAFAAARDIGAVAAHGTYNDDADPQGKRMTYHAVTSFEYVGPEPAESRAKTATKFARRQLSQVSLWLQMEFPRRGSAGALAYSYAVADRAAIISAAAEYYAHDTPARNELTELASKLAAWSVRAGIPSDEALRVAVEIGRESKR